MNDDSVLPFGKILRTLRINKELRDNRRGFIRGWCNYYALADEPDWRKDVSGWMRRHIRKCFWFR